MDRKIKITVEAFSACVRLLQDVDFLAMVIEDLSPEDQERLDDKIDRMILDREERAPKTVYDAPNGVS